MIASTITGKARVAVTVLTIITLALWTLTMVRDLRKGS